MDGFFNIHRQIFDSWVFADEKAFKLWIWLIGKARYNSGIVPLKIGKGSITVKLEIGQLLFGRFSAEEALNMDGSLIYRRLKKFEEDNMIKIESNNQYSIITICKYVDYQEQNYKSEQPTNNQRTTDEQPTNTNNKDNKENKDNNIEARAKKFGKSLDQYLTPENKSEVIKFWRYWTEPNKSKTKLRFEMEKTWETKRRLETWFKNAKTFNK